MKNVTQVCPNSSALKTLRRGYPNLPYEQQCHGEEFRVNMDLVLKKVAEKTLESISEPSHIDIALPLRAALPYIMAFSGCECSVKFHIVDVYRDEKTAETKGYIDLGDLSTSNNFVIADPMFATGNTMISIMSKAQEAGFGGVFTISSLISAPEGVLKVKKQFPGVQIITAALDSNLNESNYIVPGLGDAGDKYFDGIQGDEAKVREFINLIDSITSLSSDEKQVIYQRLMK